MNFRCRARPLSPVLQERRTHWGTWILAFVAATAILSACDSSTSSTTSSSSSPSTSNFTYTMTASPTHFPAGVYVASAQEPTTDSTCKTGAGATTRSEALVSTAGSVALAISLPTSSFTGYYLQTIYVDMDKSHSLTNNDLVWGALTTKFDGFCNLMGRDNVNLTFNWDTIVGTGVSTWSGGAQTFSVDPNLNPQAQSGDAASNLTNILSVQGSAVDRSSDQ